MIYYYFKNMNNYLKLFVNIFIPNYFIIMPLPTIQSFKKIKSIDCNINKYYKNKPYPNNLYPTDVLRANH